MPNPDLSTIKGLNEAAKALGHGFLPFDHSWGFPVKYGCLLWEVYIGTYRQALDAQGHPQVIWDSQQDVRLMGAVTVSNRPLCRQMLLLEDGYPVPGSWSEEIIVPRKVYCWSLAADTSGLVSIYTRRLPELRSLLLQRGFSNRRLHPMGGWLGWPWMDPPPKEGTLDWVEEAVKTEAARERRRQENAQTFLRVQEQYRRAEEARRAEAEKQAKALRIVESRGPKPGCVFCISPTGSRVSVPEGAACSICKRRIWAGDRVDKYRRGFRHSACEPPLIQVCQNGREIPKTAWHMEKCLVCEKSLRKPRGGRVYRHKQGFRHSGCTIALNLKGKKILAGADSFCTVCDRSLQDKDKVEKYHQGYRHADCPAPARPAPPKPKRRPKPPGTPVKWRGITAQIPSTTSCRVCKKTFKPGEEVIRSPAYGYRHENCEPPPPYTLDKKGRPVYPRGGHRRADGVWECPPRSAVGGFEPLHKVNVRPRNRPWVPRCPMLDEGEEYREEHGSGSSGSPAAFWWNWYYGDGKANAYS